MHQASAHCIVLKDREGRGRDSTGIVVIASTHWLHVGEELIVHHLELPQTREGDSHIFKEGRKGGGEGEWLQMRVKDTMMLD